MGQDISLTASDGFELGAYRCDPEGDTRGAVIVVQEIFGVNDHIRDVTERFAAVGYTAIAPALYDRWDKGFTSGYTPEDIAVGRDLKDKANAELDNVMADVEAARAHVAGAGKVGITGFCWGGFVTWMAACRLDVQAAVSYYGGGIIGYNDEEPKCPTICHFGREDGSIPMSDVDVIAGAHPDVSVHVYEADHGFHCDHRGSFNPRAANVAGMRTIRLFDEHLAG
ncbi:MAG: dienelactone hydrolase family protein [Rhodospirillaceae bacterium]|jgi:carboxymethylenebutenolidase|nr:dienelactone hydrolase family protein [Rhodospirillaceae bacterium]MBT3908963.1 dienelactone hydrolase family protein [Rhodospirillaceae bacterium]MBT5299165.1 dienelactone hydrolase family protein [Rhodospirillaceae bacterium]MBT5513145.1 dienelactone hydrolase family protein [Rhodospirillaceae bacterium]MBT6085340.1 dienelactone hydrolase family protein [Rhodospirillaceae bacterium]